MITISDGKSCKLLIDLKAGQKKILLKFNGFLNLNYKPLPPSIRTLRAIVKDFNPTGGLSEIDWITLNDDERVICLLNDDGIIIPIAHNRPFIFDVVSREMCFHYFYKSVGLKNTLSQYSSQIMH